MIRRIAVRREERLTLAPDSLRLSRVARPQQHQVLCGADRSERIEVGIPDDDFKPRGSQIAPKLLCPASVELVTRNCDVSVSRHAMSRCLVVGGSCHSG